MPKSTAPTTAVANGEGHVSRHEKWKSEGRRQLHFITSERDYDRLTTAGEDIERAQAWILRQALKEWLDRHEKRQ